MKRRNYFIFALLVSGLSLSLFGCGEKEKVTPESLLTQLNENVSEKESMEMEMERYWMPPWASAKKAPP